MKTKEQEREAKLGKIYVRKLKKEAELFKAMRQQYRNRYLDAADPTRWEMECNIDKLALDQVELQYELEEAEHEGCLVCSGELEETEETEETRGNVIPLPKRVLDS